MNWHQVPGSPSFDFSQPPDLGADYRFACDQGKGKTEATIRGYAMDDVLRVTIDGILYVMRVDSLKVASIEGADQVLVHAATVGYRVAYAPGTDEETEDDIWTLRFGHKLVPGNQV